MRHQPKNVAKYMPQRTWNNKKGEVEMAGTGKYSKAPTLGVMKSQYYHMTDEIRPDGVNVDSDEEKT